jgi:hypothetical protein
MDHSGPSRIPGTLKLVIQWTIRTPGDDDVMVMIEAAAAVVVVLVVRMVLGR